MILEQILSWFPALFVYLAGNLTLILIRFAYKLIAEETMSFPTIVKILFFPTYLIEKYYFKIDVGNKQCH